MRPRRITVKRLRRAAARRARVVHGYARLAKSLGVGHAWRRWRNDRSFRRRRLERYGQVTRGIWIEAAGAIGAEIEEVSPRIFEFRLGGAVTRVPGQHTPLSTADSVDRASDKPCAYATLRAAGLPIPDYVCVDASDASTAERFLALDPRPCVAKPARGAAGEGVVGAIRTVSQLHRAMERLAQITSEILLERAVTGDHYRLLFLDGELLDVVRRTKPRVVGDGRSTVEELMFREYERRVASPGARALKPFVADLDCLFTLELQGLGLRSVIAEGVDATVMSASNFGAPEDSETYPATGSLAFVDEGRRACDVLGVRLGGVDVIAARTDTSLARSGGAILEVNPIPGLHHHYAVADPATATRVAIPILRTLFDEAGGQPSAT